MQDGSEGFHAFAVSRGRHLFRTAYLLTGGDHHLAEDLAQETLSRVYAVWRRVSKMDSPEAYARTVLTHLFFSHKRKRSSTEVVDGRADAEERAGEEADRSLRVTLLAALAQLAPTDRAVLVLRYWEDRSVEEVAGILGISGGAVRNRSQRALSRLRDALGEGFPELIAA